MTSAYTDADLHYYAHVTAPFHDGRVPQVWFERCRGLARELLEARRERDMLRSRVLVLSECAHSEAVEHEALRKQVERVEALAEYHEKDALIYNAVNWRNSEVAERIREALLDGDTDHG